jgi:hypothetical protein
MAHHKSATRFPEHRTRTASQTESRPHDCVHATSERDAWERCVADAWTGVERSYPLALVSRPVLAKPKCCPDMRSDRHGPDGLQGTVSRNAVTWPCPGRDLCDSADHRCAHHRFSRALGIRRRESAPTSRNSCRLLGLHHGAHARRLVRRLPVSLHRLCTALPRDPGSSRVVVPRLRQVARTPPPPGPRSAISRTCTRNAPLAQSSLECVAVLGAVVCTRDDPVGDPRLKDSRRLAHLVRPQEPLRLRTLRSTLSCRPR